MQSLIDIFNLLFPFVYNSGPDPSLFALKDPNPKLLISDPDRDPSSHYPK